MAKALERLLLTLYSLMLTVALAASAPWWGWRMLRGVRYRDGLGQRLGFVPETLRAAAAGKDVVWVHAVSVGEVLAVERLIGELKQALPGWVVAVSTTTATGQKIARERLAEGGESSPVFYFPLDFAWAVRAWLGVLRPKLMVLVESEFWPRHLYECERAGVPVAVVNARVSDRSFPRYMRLRWLWRRLFAKVRVFLAQGEESAERLRAIGAAADKVVVSGNLKYDAPGGGKNGTVRRIGGLLWKPKLLVAGSTHEGEEQALLKAWETVRRQEPDTALLIAPRHPQRFDEVWELLRSARLPAFKCSYLMSATEPIFGGTVLLLDSIGDLAEMYGIASAAFVGGSLVPRGGQNPLEAARFGIPVVMGPSFENFREVSEKMIAESTLKVIDRGGLAAALVDALRQEPNGQRHFQGQTDATRKTVEALTSLLHA